MLYPVKVFKPDADGNLLLAYIIDTKELSERSSAIVKKGAWVHPSVRRKLQQVEGKVDDSWFTGGQVKEKIERKSLITHPWKQSNFNIDRTEENI